MKELYKRLAAKCRSDYRFKTVSSSAVSLLVNVLFALYNGVLGARYSLIWNGAICGYYLLLALIRVILVRFGMTEEGSGGYSVQNRRRRICVCTHILLFIVNIALIIPIAVMIRGDRAYALGMIPAIALAAYTTYRIVMAAVHYRKAGKTKNILIKELRMVNLIDALVSVLTLQNTLILVKEGGITGGMKTLSVVTSTGIWLFIAAISVLSAVLALKSAPESVPRRTKV